LLWGEYKKKHPNGYSYSQFCEHLRQWLVSNTASMHFKHEPGDKVYIDFAGDRLNIIDCKTGEIISVETYAAVLGYSQYTYVEAVFSQKKSDLIGASENALHFFGGVPKVIVPDNVKSAVTKASNYEAQINNDFMDFVNHYQIAVLPARSYKPQDKALVEKTISIIYSRIYARLRDQVFYDLRSLNEAVWALLKEHNQQHFQRRQVSRQELFEEERPLLKPLPPQRYEIRQYKVATVMKTAHVQLHEDKHYYSVPYRYIGKKVKLIYTL
jgi:transposase